MWIKCNIEGGFACLENSVRNTGELTNMSFRHAVRNLLKSMGCRLLVRFDRICEKVTPSETSVSRPPKTWGQYKTFAPTAVKIKKDIDNLSDYQCLSFNLGVFSLRKSGARGSRTLVQTGKPYAFYTLSHR